MSFSRREFLQRTSTLLAARLTGVVGAAQAGAPHLQAARGRKPTLVVLGAGMAGLAAAYQWTKAGNACVVLEARDRVGGRNWTLRGGDRVPDVQGAVQECEFDDGLYFNCGAARIPSHHAAVLSLCHELGVPLEVQVNANRSAYLYNESTGGATLRLRRAVGDAQGRVAELLLQALVRGALDDLILAADKPRMIKFLRQYGDLSANNLYEGSPRAGFERAPGVASEGAAYPPLSMSRLLDLDMWNQIAAEDDILMQATMLQPVGGMDRIPQALAKNLGPVIRLNAEVLEIRRQASHARVVYRDRRSGETHIANADFCLSTIPPPVLKSIPADFSSAIVTGLATVTGGNARKIAFESQRFWERNDGIYGGLSYLENPYAAVWYPSHGFQTSKGILVHYGAPQAFDRLSRDQQVAAARRQIALLHPGRDGELRKPLVLSWNRIPFSLGVGAYFHDSGNVLYRTLNGGEPPFYFAGDYLSAVGPWQEGAVRSAYRALELIDAKRSGDAAALG